jgi:hypothetical protein
MKRVTAWLLAAWIVGITALFFAQPYVAQALGLESANAGSIIRALLGGE